MAGFHNLVRLSTYDFPDAQLTFTLASGITTADIGKAVTQDTSGDATMKLAGDGEPILGVLYTVEDRVNEGQLVGTVKLEFAEKLPVKSGLIGAEVVAVGSLICGAGSATGEVRALDPTDAADAKLIPYAPRVWAVSGGYATATLV